MTSSTRSDRRFDRVMVVANPRAGSACPRFVTQVERMCAEYIRHVDVRWTCYPGHATELASRSTLAACHDGRAVGIVVVGGDGTFQEVASGLLTSNNSADAVSLIVLPGGTGNSNYRSLWDDASWQRTLTAALTGAGAEWRTLDLAQISASARVVVLGLSTGLFAAATAMAASIPVAGRARYLSALDAVLPSYTPYEGRVIVDGIVLHEGKTLLANVGGGRHRAGVFQILPHSVRDDGLLDVCVIGAEVPAGDALSLMLTGDHLARDGVFYGQGRRIALERTDGAPLRFEHDGAVVPVDTASVTIRVLPGQLPVVASNRRLGG